MGRLTSGNKEHRNTAIRRRHSGFFKKLLCDWSPTPIAFFWIFVLGLFFGLPFEATGRICVSFLVGFFVFEPCHRFVRLVHLRLYRSFLRLK